MIRLILQLYNEVGQKENNNSLKKRFWVPLLNVHWITVAPYFKIFADDPEGCVRTIISWLAIFCQRIELVLSSALILGLVNVMSIMISKWNLYGVRKRQGYFTG